MKGRKPKMKPTLVAIQGNRCDLPNSSAETVKGIQHIAIPSPPSWLTNHAKREWKRCAPELHRRNLLTPDMLATLESYCVAAGQVREFEEAMGQDGRMVNTPAGPKPHPAFKMQQAAMREARLLAAELALTPQRQGTKGKDGEGKGDGWDADLLA